MEDVKGEISLKSISLSHKEAPIEIREMLSFNEDQTKDFLLYLKDVSGIQEAFLLSTCNRTEVYFYDVISTDVVLKSLAAYKGITVAQIYPHFKFFTETSDSVLHLFRVGIGLESQILGDFQIINQVKNAYQWCADVQMAGPVLHRLLHTIFFANKRIVQETNFRSGSASVSYATKELIEELITDKSQPVAVIGLGEIGLATARNLAENGFSNITICNRTESKVLPLIKEFGLKFRKFEDWEDVLLNTKVVISSVSGEVLKVNKRHFENKKLVGYQYLIDLGVPRSINTDVELVDGVILFNIDQINIRVNSALKMRIDSIPSVEKIVNENHSEFLEWTREMQVSPVIHQIKNALEQIRQEEMSRFLKKAELEQVAWAEELTKNLMQRIMKNHVVQLKAACKRGDSDQLVEVLNQIFNLEVPSEA